jgi:DnaJ family protein C protein 19
MVVPILVGLGLATAFCAVRSGIRAYARLKRIPPYAFGDTRQTFNETGGGKAKFHPGGFDQQMTVDEAIKILGLQGNSSLNSQEILKAYRRTMLANHPDKGGSSYIAMKINEAKDILEKRY